MNMKKSNIQPFLICFLFLVVFPIVSSNAKIDLTISTSFFFDQPVQELSVYLQAYPRETPYARVFLFHDVQQKDNALVYSFKNIQYGNINLSARIYTKEILPKQLKQKIPWPYPFSSQEQQSLRPYLQPTSLITSNHSQIRSIAQTIAREQNNFDHDYAKAVAAVAAWVTEHIAYNLTTLTANAVLSADETLTNGYGVCDEITVLTLALWRALGIPSRYVSGVTYLPKEQRFGNHGWAEVYLPSLGWLPVDIVYHQIFWLDDTHIKFRDSIDANEPAVHYEWEAQDSRKLKTTGLQTKGSYLALKQFNLSSYLTFSTDFLQETIAPGSLDRLSISLSNPHDFYLPYAITINAPKEVTFFKKPFALGILAPQEQKTLTFDFSVSEEFLTNYVYSLPFLVEGKEKILTVKESGTYLASLPQENTSKEQISCALTKSFFYLYEPVSIQCSIDAPRYELCFNGCKTYENQKTILLQSYVQQAGRQEFQVLIRIANQTKIITLPAEIRNIPLLLVKAQKEINVPYGQDIMFPVYIDVIGDKPRNATLIIQLGSLKKTIALKEFPKSYTIKLPAENFPSSSVLSYTVIYEDAQGRQYQLQDAANIVIITENSQEKVNAKVHSFMSWLQENVVIGLFLILFVLFTFIILGIDIAEIEKLEKVEEEEEKELKKLKKEEKKLEENDEKLLEMGE